MKKMEHYTSPTLTIENLSKALIEANSELADANAKLIYSNQMRDEMFANISHDLRSPITALHNSIEYLQSLEHPTDKELKSILSIMNSKVTFLEKMMQDVFLLTKLDMKNDILHLENVPVNAFLEDFFYSCEADSKYNTRKLKLDIDNSSNIFFNIDPFYMRRVLDNLFTNALKYSDLDSSITLQTDIKENQLFVSVTDTGFGIDAAHIDHIFERTYMVSDARTPENNTGCGLGLSIAYSIIKKHHGTLSCNSIKEKGSTFTVMLPL